MKAVLSFQVAENAIIWPTALRPQLQVLLIQAALADGWVVVVPDFQGPTAAFVDQRGAGQSSWLTGTDEKATLALWGYSAGALDTKFAAEIQPKHAKELNLAGAAFGGTGGDYFDSLRQLNAGPHADLMAFSLIGVANENRDFQSVFGPERQGAV
ncbi:hypothetical protein E4U41_006286 [Claviceps citrina]|nr:hypothetical protein E4U41_006286 [Claviceps citrina]